MKKITIYTDGSSIGNPGFGGWAAILMYKDSKKEISGNALSVTNNQMEITAAIKALEALKSKCDVDLYTDSEYVRKGITEWIYNWIKNDWKSGRKSIKNVDLWKSLYALSNQHNINWHWVKGHSGNKYNEIVDKLAYSAAQDAKANL